MERIMIAEGSGVTIHIAASYGRWAQRAERRHDKPEADGSIPSATTRHPSFNGQGTRLRTAKWGFDSLRVHAAISSSAAERLPHTQFGAGSSPAWSTEDEPKAVAGPGREPGVSGFESRHPPRAGGTAATALGCKPGIPHAGSSPARPTPRLPAVSPMGMAHCANRRGDADVLRGRRWCDLTRLLLARCLVLWPGGCSW